jgi:hypothetical protein
VRNPVLLCLYAAAMGILEAIVVVYLRRIYYPAGFGFPLVAMDPTILRAEVIREGMTLVMLAAVAGIAAERAWQRLLSFIVAFGVWDVFYYAGLKAFLDWPASWLTPDILFLIPRVWVGPVLAPVLVSAAWVAGGLLLHRTRYSDLGMGWKSWVAAAGGAGIVLAAFLTSSSNEPAFSWPLFLCGYAPGVGVLIRLVLRARGRRPRGATSPRPEPSRTPGDSPLD